MCVLLSLFDVHIYIYIYVCVCVCVYIYNQLTKTLIW